jgi:hypothetical protein
MHQNPRCRTGDVKVAYGTDNPAPPPCRSLGRGVAQTMESAGVCYVPILLLSWLCVGGHARALDSSDSKKQEAVSEWAEMEAMPPPSRSPALVGKSDGAEWAHSAEASFCRASNSIPARTTSNFPGRSQPGIPFDNLCGAECL